MLVQEQKQANLVHFIDLRERERTPHKPRHPLAKNAVEALNVAGLACAFARRPVLLLGQHLGVGRPEVGVAQPALVRRRCTPQERAPKAGGTPPRPGGR